MTSTTLLPFQPDTMTPAQLAAVSYLARYTGQTHKLYAYQLRRWFAWCGTSALDPLAGIQRAHIELYIRHLHDQGMRDSSINTMMHGVRGFFRFAHIDGLIAADPAIYARLPKIHADETRTQGLDRLELIRFLGQRPCAQIDAVPAAPAASNDVMQTPARSTGGAFLTKSSSSPQSAPHPAPPSATAAGPKLRTDVRLTVERRLREHIMARGDRIRVGDISGSQGVAVGRSAQAHVQGANVNVPSSEELDVPSLSKSLKALYGAVGNEPFGIDEKIATQGALSSALQALENNASVNEVLETVRQAGETLQSADVVVAKGTSLWTEVKEIAEKLGPIVGGAAAVAGWFGAVI